MDTMVGMHLMVITFPIMVKTSPRPQSNAAKVVRTATKVHIELLGLHPDPAGELTVLSQTRWLMLPVMTNLHIDKKVTFFFFLPEAFGGLEYAENAIAVPHIFSICVHCIYTV